MTGGRWERKLGNCGGLGRSQEHRDHHNCQKWHRDPQKNQILEEFAGFFMD